MSAPSEIRAMLPAALALAGLLVVVALVQDRWIGRWSEVEDARLRTALVEGARDVDEALSERIARTAVPFVEIAAPASDLADTLVARLGTMDREKALPIREVYWVTPGSSPSLLRLDRDVVALVPSGWDEAGTDWERYFTRDPALLREDVPLALTNRDAPSTPPAIALPAFPRPGEPAPFVLVTLDTAALAATTLPDLLRDHLGLGGAFEVTVGPPGGFPLYSRGGPTRLDDPDLLRPVGATLLSAVRVTLTGTDGVQELEIDQGELRPGAALWELRVQHRAGSIGAAVARLRWQQRGLALAVLLVLAGAVALLLRSAHAQRVLARQQMAFVAGVSHELRTPLAVLGSAGENLADGVATDPEAVRTYGALVRDESRRLAETVESVLALGGVDARAPSREAVSVREIVQEAAEAGRAVLAETGTTLTLDLAPDLPPILADRRAMVAAVRNLIANAARHGGARAVLSADQAGETVRIALTDDGPGPPPGLDLFEPFARGDASARGSGLGLALVRRVAEHHGGTARLGQTAEGLTRASLTIPVAP